MPPKPTKPPTTKSIKQSLPGIDSAAACIESCETRLALSASLAADMLLDALEIQPASLGQPSDTIDTTAATADSPDLLAQAADLRQSHGLDGSGQTVAVIDSGIAYDHVALGGGFGPGYRVVGGWDFAENDSNPYDDGPAGFHGSHVAGLLGGSTDTFQGVAPGADLVALRVFDDNGAGELEWIESALRWVHDNQDNFESPITTVNLSVGAALTSENHAEATAILADELQLLRDDQILVFAASGNFFGTDLGGEQEILFPASEPNVVAVTSVDADGSLSDFAQRESGILAARGESIRSSVPDHVFGFDGNVDDFATLDGTSMATPQASGASVLIRQSLIDQGIEPTADEILARLYQSSQSNVDPITGATYNTIDLSQAITSDPVTDSIADEPAGNDPVANDPVTETVQNDIDRFTGTTGSEDIQLDLRDGVKLRIGDSTYTLNQISGDDPFVIDVGGGADSIEIIGSEATERLIARPVAQSGDAVGYSSLSTNDFEIQLRGFENIIFDGGGGRDRATLFDSANDDSFSSGPEETILEGIGFKFDVSNVTRVFTHATAGGDDTAYLHDSAGDDELSVRPQFTSLRNEDTFQLAYGFERVYAYANNGGIDTAEIYDSAGDDTLNVSANRSIISGPDYQVSARGFSSVIGYATAGGDDVARIYADSTSSRWNSTDDILQWTGQNDDVRIARGFERTEAFEDFQPIALTPLSQTSPVDWLLEDENDRQDRAAQEAEAARSVFADFGRE